MIVGITGGLGTGKTLVLKHLMMIGFRGIDSDEIVHNYVYLLPEVVEQIRVKFGNFVIAPDGSISRFALGRLIFADAAARRQLELIVHPLVFDRWRSLLAGEPTGSWAVEVPLLFENRLENWFDFIVCVTCAPAQQLVRLEQRGLTRAQAVQRISTQLPSARKVELSDFVLLNDGSPEFLHKQIDRLVDVMTVASR